MSGGKVTRYIPLLGTGGDHVGIFHITVSVNIRVRCYVVLAGAPLKLSYRFQRILGASRMSESRDPEMKLREGDVITHRREDCQTKCCVLDPKVIQIRCRDKEARSDLFLLFTAGNLVKGDAPPRVRNVDDAVYAWESTLHEAVRSST